MLARTRVILCAGRVSFAKNWTPKIMLPSTRYGGSQIVLDACKIFTYHQGRAIESLRTPEAKSNKQWREEEGRPIGRLFHTDDPDPYGDRT